jgi:regulator of sigma E protease
MEFITTALWFIIVLGVLVLVHELGHFIVAKLCGVSVETFSIGFGRRLFGFVHKGTDYRISLLPLGGYVKMAGEQPGDTSTGDPGEFCARPRWQRMLIALAGPVSNFILAFVLITWMGLFHHEVEQYLTRPATVDWVLRSTPAAAAGIQPGDTITAFDSVANPTWRDVFEHSLLNLNQRVPVSYTHHGAQTATFLTIRSEGPADDFALDDVGLVPVVQDTPVEVMHLEPDMPAAAAGMQSGDQILAIDGYPLHSVVALLAYLQDVGGHPITLSVNRHGIPLMLHLTPELAPGNNGLKLYRIGFQAMPVPVDVVKLPLRDALHEAAKSNYHDSKLILSVVRHMFGGRVSVKSLSGPIGIGQQIGLALRLGKWKLVEMMATISLNLGIFNLLPFPILDGGLLLFLVIESIIRRDIDAVWKERIYQAAFIVLISFAAFVVFNDITKLLPTHLRI